MAKIPRKGAPFSSNVRNWWGKYVQKFAGGHGAWGSDLLALILLGTAVRNAAMNFPPLLVYMERIFLEFHGKSSTSRSYSSKIVDLSCGRGLV